MTVVDRLQVRVYPNRRRLGKAAGAEVAARMKDLLSRKERIRMVFAAAPSQNELLEALGNAEGVAWDRVVAFHMDEYLGLEAGAPQSFQRYLRDRLFDRVRPAEVHFIDSKAEPETECRRYAALLGRAPIDIVCLGIGENGHLAFNDPPVADFDDPQRIKVVELDPACREQQVHDGCFPSLEDVPRLALTLTIPTLMSAARLSCVVPGRNKRAAVARTLTGAVHPSCPASILRRHSDATLYLDADAYGA